MALFVQAQHMRTVTYHPVIIVKFLIKRNCCLSCWANGNNRNIKGAYAAAEVWIINLVDSSFCLWNES